MITLNQTQLQLLQLTHIHIERVVLRVELLHTFTPHNRWWFDCWKSFDKSQRFPRHEILHSFPISVFASNKTKGPGRVCAVCVYVIHFYLWFDFFCLFVMRNLCLVLTDWIKTKKKGFPFSLSPAKKRSEKCDRINPLYLVCRYLSQNKMSQLVNVSGAKYVSCVNSNGKRIRTQSRSFCEMCVSGVVYTRRGMYIVWIGVWVISSYLSFSLASHSIENKGNVRTHVPLPYRNIFINAHTVYGSVRCTLYHF